MDSVLKQSKEKDTCYGSEDKCGKIEVLPWRNQVE